MPRRVKAAGREAQLHRAGPLGILAEHSHAPRGRVKRKDHRKQVRAGGVASDVILDNPRQLAARRVAETHRPAGQLQVPRIHHALSHHLKLVCVGRGGRRRGGVAAAGAACGRRALALLSPLLLLAAAAASPRCCCCCCCC